jgi:hypothetical protein
LTSKVGIDEGTAAKVADFIKDHIDDIPGWIGKAGLGGMFGGIGEKIGDMFGDKKD